MGAKTEKIRVTVRCEEVRELEVSFPYFVNDGAYYCKFTRIGTALTVVDHPFSKEIKYGNVPGDWLAFNPITEEEFNAKFYEVLNSLI